MTRPINKPVDVATAHSVSFVVQHVPRGAAIVEVGSGEGHVALALQQRGYHVKAIDRDAEVVASARSAAAPVSHAEWPDYDPGPVDAVLFTRSLHHIHALNRAIGRAKEVLRAGGRLLLEDFAFDQAGETTIDWFLGVLRSGDVKSLICGGEDEFISRLLRAKLPIDAWHENHDHDLHSIDIMRETIAEHFSIEREQAVPYLYRYLIPVLPPSPTAATVLERILDEEQRAAETGEIRPIGRRIVAAMP